MDCGATGLSVETERTLGRVQVHMMVVWAVTVRMENVDELEGCLADQGDEA